MLILFSAFFDPGFAFSVFDSFFSGTAFSSGRPITAMLSDGTDVFFFNRKSNIEENLLNKKEALTII